MKKTFTLFLSAISFFAAAQVDLSDGLVAYYPLDGNTNDYSGNNFHLTATDVTPVNDKSGNAAGAYSFNGSTSKMQTSTSPDFGGSHSVSVSLWTKSNAESGIKYIFYCNNFGLATNGPSAYMVVSIPGTNAASGVITQNEWTHLTGTYDGTDIKIYINNVLAATKNWPSDLSFSTQPIQLGIFSTTFWQGELDEVRVYSRILNTDEIDALYNFTNPVTGTANAETTLNGLYPVPATTRIRIPSEIETADTQAKILKADGTLISTTNLDGSHELQVQTLDQGIYILQILNEKSSFTGRFVKE